jgi:hypothetical protein
MCLECVDDAYEQAHQILAARKADEQLFAEVRRCAFCVPFPIASALSSQTCASGSLVDVKGPSHP